MIKLMIIEDDPMVRTINEKFAKKLDSYEVVSSVNDIKEAKDYLQENDVDLILLDMYLPSGSGFEVLKWIRENEIQSDVILITAENGVNAINEAFRYGVVDYLIKPFSFNRFKEALEKYRERAKRVNCNSKLQQEIIDKYILGINSLEEKESRLIKGINLNTYNQIMNFIKSYNEEFTAEFAAEKVGLARVTVRRYLEYMIKENKLELIQTYGKVGRPTNYYRFK